jgi:hypothetical protein
LDERDDLVAILIAENPIGLLLQILEGDNFVGVDENGDVFNDLLMHKEIGRPEVKRTPQTGGRFGAPIVECITELRRTPCQSMSWPFGKV